jgi:pimeloyl-ACP methyl ester carboxylesterase
MLEVVSIPARDGRFLEARLGGDPNGFAVLAHHGTPGVGIAGPDELAAFLERRLRYVAVARPGYAGSTRRPSRSIAAVADDAATVLDHLGLERAYTIGSSGGGPHALACAALLGDRIVAATTIAGAGPFGADGLDFLDGMAQENIDEFGAALAGPDALAVFLEAQVPTYGAVTGPEIAEAFGGLAPPVDRAALTGDYAESVAEDVRLALANGIWGWFDDDLAFLRPWGFDVAAIRVPVDVWQGAQDTMVPFAHGRWLADHCGTVRAHLSADHGHLSLAAASIRPILDAMLERTPV